MEEVTNEMEKSFAQTHLDQSGFESFKEELGPSKNSTLKRDFSMDVSYDEHDRNQVDAEIENQRLAGITEEVSTASKEISEKQDEATTVYEREEQKYIAEEKEVVTSYQEVEEEFSSVTNQIIATSEMKEEIFKIEKDKDLSDEIQAHRIEKEEDIIMKLAQ